MVHSSHPPHAIDFKEIQFFDCLVKSAGPIEDGAIAVNLTATSGEFTEIWFNAWHPIRQQILETALAALQSGLHCQVGLSGTSQDSQIYRIHANAR
jgi:hypothetical protein